MLADRELWFALELSSSAGPQVVRANANKVMSGKQLLQHVHIHGGPLWSCLSLSVYGEGLWWIPIYIVWPSYLWE